MLFMKMCAFFFHAWNASRSCLCWPFSYKNFLDSPWTLCTQFIDCLLTFLYRLFWLPRFCALCTCLHWWVDLLTETATMINFSAAFLLWFSLSVTGCLRCVLWAAVHAALCRLIEIQMLPRSACIFNFAWSRCVIARHLFLPELTVSARSHF